MMSKRVLIVEDDKDIRESLKECLDTLGFEIDQAPNGKIALEILKYRALPSLIFLDLMMPVMNGWEFLKARSGDPVLQAIPVVVVTAAGLAAGEQPASVQGFLRKPLELEDLLEAVKSAARLR